MNPQNWQKFEEIFQSALDLSGAERRAFLEKECAGDKELRREIENFIAGYEEEENFLESPVWTDSRFLQSEVKKEIAASLDDGTIIDNNESVFINRKVGVYRLVKTIGKGGMGEVFLAERADGEFSQKVAVKLIKRGMDTDFIVKRFRHERQIAAALNHPNIARLFDGGTTDAGLPFFVMEYVEGEPFFKYSDAQNLDLREKLELFLAVCAAISYAHRRKIIHRDIKPSNILVNEDGMPKLLDFGIAKLLDSDLIHESMMPQTGTQMRLMTPEYASPEQVRGDEITTASDQYSLGVLLYELITGTRPYKFSSRAPHEIARVICEEIPSQPSSESFGKTPTGDFSFDKVSCEKLDRIVLKSLEKNPSERYDSVKDFADDIEHFLRGEPIRAASSAENNRHLAELPAKISDSFEQKANQKSIAVLPLKNLNALSGEQTESGDYLNVGLADALVTRLSNVREFIVRPTSSVLRYAASDTDSFAAGRELKVRFVLDGNILRTEKRIRVSVQLLNIAEESTVWAERFDEDLTDVLTLEDSISKRVAESLVPRLSTGDANNLAQRATDNAAAYECFMRGRVFWNTFTKDGMRRAVEFYEEAIRLDPNYAQAYAAIADYYVWLGMSCFMPPDEFYPLAKRAVSRAVELDPNSSEAYAARGLMEIYGNYDWTESEKNMRRAIELNPNNAVAHNWFFHPLYTRGEFAAGRRHLLRSLELDPTSFQNHNSYAWSLYFERRMDEAVVKADELIEKFPQTAYSYFAKSSFLRVQGETVEALGLARRAAELSDDGLFTYFGLGAALAADGKRAEAEKILANPPAGFSSNYHAAEICCALKDKEKAFEFLAKAFAAKEVPLVWLAVDPSLDLIRDDARYFALLEKMNHPLANHRENLSTPIEVKGEITTAHRRPPTASEAETIIQTTESAASPTRQIPAALKYALAVIAVIIGGFFIYYVVSHIKIGSSFAVSEGNASRNWRSIFASTMSIRRLTTSGREHLAAISPDGEKIAYVTHQDETQSIWIRPINSENARQIAAPEAVVIVGLTFSPDQKYVYYTQFDRSLTQRTLWRVSAEGGAAQKVLDYVNSPVSFAADGKRLAYFSFDRNAKSVNLIVAELKEDGTLQSLKTVTTRFQPDYFAGAPALSPDASRVVYAVVAEGEKRTINLYLSNLETGAEEKLVARDFRDVYSIVWRGNENEIVVNAAEMNSPLLQLWLVAYPSGEISRLTNDFNNYTGISLSKNSDALVTVKEETVSNVAVVGWEKGQHSFETITEGAGKSDGLKGIGWTADNRILYIDRAGDKNSIRLINTDGSGGKTIETGDALPTVPLLTGDGKNLFFIDEKNGESKFRRYETATGALTDATSQTVMTPTLTPDDRFIIYTAFNANRVPTLHRAPINGGEATELTSVKAYNPSVSSDNRLIAAYFSNADTKGWQIGIFPVEGGSPIRVIDPPETVIPISFLERPLFWSADASFIYYLNNKGGVSNVYRVTTDGTNKTERLTNFTSGTIFDFALAPDEKHVAVARGSISSDIVIFKNSR